MGRKFPTIRDGLHSVSSGMSVSGDSEHLHVVIVSSDRKRKAASNTITCWFGIRALQRATGEHGLLGIVEGDSAELFPIADQLVFDDDLVNSKFALQE